MKPDPDICGVILAGGRSARMGQDKALVPFAGRPMIAHVIERFRPQVASLAINHNGNAKVFEPFGLPVLPDRDSTRPGPLAGIAAALEWARMAGFARLATVPCDVPFLPRDLVAILQREAGLAMAESRNGLEPLFGLWPVSALTDIELALRDGRQSVWRLAEDMGVAKVALDSADEDWWLNLNTPEELATAEVRL